MRTALEKSESSLGQYLTSLDLSFSKDFTSLDQVLSKVLVKIYVHLLFKVTIWNKNFFKISAFQISTNNAQFFKRNLLI